MANRYKRFFGGAPSYTQLSAFAAQLSDLGHPARVDLAFSIAGTGEVHFELRCPSLSLSVQTFGDIQWVETGQVPDLDRVTDEAFLDWLREDPKATATCSHCYSHWSDNSDLDGAWAPNPSLSCDFTNERRGALRSKDAA